MQFSVKEDISYNDVKNGGFGSKWIRALLVERKAYNELYESYSPTKLDEPVGCKWVCANDYSIEDVSACAYYFAHKLMSDLQMPIGIINANMGGSSITSWISRETLENDAKALQILKDHESYFSLEEYYQSGCTLGSALFMSSNYNDKIYPVRNLKISGMIWYQGECDVGMKYVRGEYEYMFNILQDEMSKTFNFDGDLPIIMASLASYGPYYTPVQLFNDELATIQSKKPESRALVTQYDITPYYTGATNAIHPNNKKPIGERMEECALGLVYGKNGIKSAPYVISTKIEANKIFVTLDNVGDGLKLKGDTAYDFAVCGEDGCYYKAEMKIESKDTISIWSKEVDKPISASYAISSANIRANLYATKNGEILMPVAAFVTDIENSKVYYTDSPSMDMELNERWIDHPSYAGWYPLWNSENAEISVEKESSFIGNSGLNITSKNKSFSISEKFVIENNGDDYFNGKVLDCFNNNWSLYKSLKVRVRNNGKNDVYIKNLKVITGENLWYSPTINGTGKIYTSIPADGNWHTIEFDLNDIYLFGLPIVKSDSLDLAEILEVKLNFYSNDEASIDIDEFEFSSKLESEASKVPVNVVIRIVRFVQNIKEFFQKIFIKLRGVKMAARITEIFTDEKKYDGTEDFSYGEHELQKFDLVIPKDAGKELNIIIRIHGGAWVAGEKENCTTEMASYVKKYKMVGLNIDYRLCAMGTHAVDCNVMLDDIHNAIKSAVKICNDKGYTLKKALVAGESAGAHLALMYSYKMQNESPVEIGLVYSNCAPTDMTDKNYVGGISTFKFEDILNLSSLLIGEDIEEDKFESSEVVEKIGKACPLVYMSEKIPPTILNSCGKDVLVPVSNAELLVAELEKYGVDYYYAKFNNSTHCGRDAKDILTTTKFDRHLDQMIKKYLG